MIDLSGRTAIVTGGTAGIGRACALALADARADLVLVGRRPDRLEATIAELTDRGVRAIGVRGDVQRADTVARMADDAVQAFGRIDILVNNAGASYGEDFRRLPLDELEPEELMAAVRLNVASAFACSKAVRPHLGRGASIVNVASIVANHPIVGFGFYSPAKAALINLTQLMALEWAPDVRVNCVLPGHIDTPRSSSTRTLEVTAALVRGIAMGRMGTPTDVAGAVLYLASDLAAWTTGAALDVNGGLRTI